MINKSIFLGKEIDVYGTADSPLFKAKDVAEWIEHSDAHKLVEMVDEDEKVRNIVPTLGGNQEMWFLTEDGLYEVLMLSRKPIAKQFKKGVKDILKSIRKTGSFVSSSIKEEAEIGLLFVREAKSLLNLSDDSVAAMYNKVASKFNQPLIDYVPSKGVSKPVSDLLKDFNVGISAQAFNKLLANNGIIVKMFRNSTGGKKKTFWNIPKEYLAYGENYNPIQSHGSTEPYWYVDKFNELLKLVGLA